ncbi:histone deacetylase superfamily protein [unidentified eubacterium SCB49]|nr:histone deacetylase superfamily protein [unidentified eubacterium SCB49]
MLKVAYHPIFKYSLPEGHRFPMAKYELLPQYLLDQGICTLDNFFEPQKVSEASILKVHTEDYYRRLLKLEIDKKEVRKMGFPLRKALVDRGHYIIDGTIKGCEYAIEYGVSMNSAGGTHHAYADHGEAFCLLNDQAVAARHLLDLGIAKQVLIVDLDVHQGNGTAKIFENDDRVFTFSMHGAKNYPFKKDRSDLDIGLDDGTEDAEYLEVLYNTLPKLIKKVNPDFIFYLSGVDILKTDKLGRLSCTIEGSKERDRFVLQTCKDHNIPVQISMGGGYSPDIDLIIEAHANTYKMAQAVFF